MALLDEVLDYVRSRRVPAYLVGGTVRDLLLRRPRYDIDLAVEGDASQLARSFADAAGGAFYVMDEEHDVARVILDREQDRFLVDFARVRGEAIELDLATRDFTVNAMALDISQPGAHGGMLIDPFGGSADLAARRLSSVSSSIFVNDPVRLLRAVRFEATLGLAMDDATEAEARKDARRLPAGSPERVRDELYRILAAENILRNLRRLDDLGLLGGILPEVVALKQVGQPAPHVYDVFEHTLRAAGELEQTQQSGYLDIAEGAFVEHLVPHFEQALLGGHTRGVLLRLTLLLHDIGKPAAKSLEESGRIRFFGHEEVGAEMAENALRRLRFSNQEIELATGIIANHLRPIHLQAVQSVTDRAVYRYFRATGSAGVDIAIHAWCDQRATLGPDYDLANESRLQAVIARLLDRYYHAREQTVSPPPLLNGREVMQELGVGQGPQVGRMLEALLEAQATAQVSTREQAIQFLKEWKEGTVPSPDPPN